MREIFFMTLMTVLQRTILSQGIGLLVALTTVPLIKKYIQSTALDRLYQICLDFQISTQS